MLDGIKLLGTKAFAALDMLQAAGKPLHRIAWHPTIAPGEVESALRARGVPVYARDIPLRTGDAAAVSVPAAQRKWAEEIVHVQMAQAPIGEVLPATERRMKRPANRGRKSRTWGQPRRSGTIADGLAALVERMLDFR